MFIGVEDRLGVGFSAAQARLPELYGSGPAGSIKLKPGPRQGGEMTTSGRMPTGRRRP
jgi:hypothetical protein